MKPKTEERRKTNVTYQTDKLKALIIERYGTQKRFAEAVGINQSTLSRYLAGRSWGGEELVRAAKALGISFDEINAYFFAPEVSNLKPKEKAVK